jgi:hypothetical protein
LGGYIPPGYVASQRLNLPLVWPVMSCEKDGERMLLERVPVGWV